MVLDGRDPRVAGLGLAAFMLIRFPAATSGTLLILRPSPETTLLGLATFFAATDPLAGFDTGAGRSMTVRAVGLRNMPRPISQSKYLSPCTLPSFLPLSSSSSTPTHSPAAKCGCPTNRTVPKRPSTSSTVWPRSSSDMMRESSGSERPWDRRRGIGGGAGSRGGSHRLPQSVDF